MYDKDQGGAAEGLLSQEPGSPQASPRTRGRTQAFSSALASALARSTTALDALPWTLEEVMRHWRVGERKIVVEFSLPEYKFLLDAAEMSSGRLGAALFRIRMLLRHTVNPRGVQPITASRSWRASHASGNESSGRMSFYTPRASLSQLAGDAVNASRASFAALLGSHSRHNSLVSMASTSMRFTMQPADFAEDGTGGWGHPGEDEPLPAGPASGPTALALHRQKMAAQRQAAALGGDAPQMPPRIPGRSSLKARSSYTGAVDSVLTDGLKNADIQPEPPPPPPARTPPTPTPPHYAMPTESAAIALAERPVSSATQRRALVTPTTATRSRQTPP